MKVGCDGFVQGAATRDGAELFRRGLRYQWAVSWAPPGDGWHLDNIRTCTNPVPCDPTPVPTMLSERY